MSSLKLRLVVKVKRFSGWENIEVPESQKSGLKLVWRDE